MSLSSISIRRPVLAIVMSIAIILFGVIGYTFLGVREFPNVDPPVITVSTSYVGANADIVESQITEPLEESINGIDGIRTLTSISRDGRSTISVEFNIDSDIEAAANDVRDRVARAVSQLPPDVNPPVVAKADADANPIVFLNIKSNSKDLLTLSEIASNIFKERLQTIPGVSQVQIWGEKRYTMRLWLDPDKMAGYGITPIDVKRALDRENIELPSGSIDGLSTQLSVRTFGRLNTIEEFENLIIKEDNEAVIRLKNIGKAELYPENDKSILRRDGVPMVGCVLIPQPGSNHIQIVDEFYKRVDELKKDLPIDISLGIGFDTTKFIRDSINEVVQTIGLAFVLVILIIYLFLRDFRTTIIPLLAIPVSLIGTFFIMYLFNFSINVLTLLGIVLAIGIVVDDAIVVLENIYKKIETGMHPIEAGMKGTREIFFAVISTTVALVSVFLPILFLQGLSGRLFREFGIVLGAAVIISSFVALSLTPMLSSRIIRNGKSKTDNEDPSNTDKNSAIKHGLIFKITEPMFVKINSVYANALESFMNKRWLAFVIIVISLAIFILIAPNIPSELAPISDRSGMRIFATAPEGTSFEKMDTYMKQIASFVQQEVPEREAVIAITSPGFGAASSTNSGFIRLVLKDPDRRKRSQQQIANDLGMKLLKFNNTRNFVIQDQTISTFQRGSVSLPVQYVLKAESIEKLREILPKFLDEARKDPTFLVVDANLKFNKPEIVVEIDRTKAATMGISSYDIAQTLQLALSGMRYGYFIMNGKQYQVIGQLPLENRRTPLDLKSLYIRSNSGELIQLDNLVTLKNSSTPPQLFRYNRFTSATISASLAPGKTIGDGINVMDRIADKILDESVSTALEGPSKDFSESSSTLLYTFILALILVYLVLSAQFESFRDPFVIMLTVPLALGGSILSLWYFDQTLNIFSQIGQIMLIGLVTKNGILIVEFANQIRAMGVEKIEAVKRAAALRFRPILMTSLSTILGTLPIALALGAGSESRVSMGIAIIGGLIFSTFLTLFVIPAMYSYISSNKTDKLKNFLVKENEPVAE